MIEMVYHLQLNAALGPELQFMGVDARRRRACDSWFGAGVRDARSASACSSWRAASSCAQWGEIQEDIENEIKRREARMSAHDARDGAAHGASNCKDLRKSFGKTEIIRGVNLAVRRRRAHRRHRAQRRRQVHAVQPDQRPLRAHQRRGAAATASASTARSRSRSTAWACRAASRSPTSSPSSACSRTCAAACCGAWATATPS